ncbi:hypothetical protein GGF46_004850, partial [Coemansia sp. RSA 552]
AQAAQAKFSEMRVRYGVDEPTAAYCQIPIFTLPKPNTDARRVLFDNSANNCVNMEHHGIQLATVNERVTFVRDAQILSSLDLASFFTAVRLHPDVRDFWCYRNGPHHRLRTTRMVQGNSESPAITQAFLEHVLNEIKELWGKLLIYIDNVYLKSTTGDMDEHIQDLGHVVAALDKYNLLLNLDKSMLCGTHQVDV